MVINGVAHIILTVSQFERSRQFYLGLLKFLGLEKVNDSPEFLYFVGGRTAIGIQPCDPKFKNERFEQKRVGLHHVCLRAKTADAIDLCHEFLEKIDAKIITPPSFGKWAPGYYYVLFEDPDGIRLEVNYVPGKGVLADGVEFNPVDYVNSNKKS